MHLASLAMSLSGLAFSALSLSVYRERVYLPFESLCVGWTKLTVQQVSLSVYL